MDKRIVGAVIGVALVLALVLGQCGGSDDSNSQDTPIAAAQPTLRPATPTPGNVVAQAEPAPTAAPTPTIAPTATPMPSPAAVPTPTIIPTLTPTPQAAFASRENPVPLGVAANLNLKDPTNTWEFAVTNVVPDAWELIQEENQFNDPPAAGRQFTIVRVRAKYLGPESKSLLFNVSFKALGEQAVVYSGSFDCGVLPDDLDTTAELYTGGTIEGNLCFVIADSEAESLLLIVEFGIFNSVRYWFSLAPGN